MNVALAALGPVAIAYFVLGPISIALVALVAVEIYRGRQSEKQSDRRLREVESLLDPKYRDLVRSCP